MSKSRDRGFSLIELMVSITIISVLMTVVLYNYDSFNDNLTLSSAAQEVAIAMRQAQTYGIDVKEITTGSGQFSSGYGIYFDTRDPTHYYIFADKDNSHTYDEGGGCGSGPGTECIEKLTLRSGITISDLCDISNTCPPANSVTSMDVTFVRPNPDATIDFANNGGNIKASSLAGKVKLLSLNGKTLTVIIQSTGQIYIQ